MGKWSYGIWQLLSIVLPAALLTLTYWRYIKPARKAIAFSILAALLFGWPWDLVMIKGEVWQFNPQYIFGFWLLGIPLEEFAFIITTTWLFCVLTLVLYHKRRNP